MFRVRYVCLSNPFLYFSGVKGANLERILRKEGMQVWIPRYLPCWITINFEIVCDYDWDDVIDKRSVVPVLSYLPIVSCVNVRWSNNCDIKALLIELCIDVRLEIIIILSCQFARFLTSTCHVLLFKYANSRVD